MAYHKSMSAAQMTVNTIWNWIPLEFELRDEPILAHIRRMISPTAATAPMKQIVVASRSQSLFMICVSSWAATASISRFLSLCVIPLENTIHDLFGFHPTAKAFMLSSSNMPIFGGGNHREMQRFSTML